jgi:hypothetical protein
MEPRQVEEKARRMLERARALIVEELAAHEQPANGAEGPGVLAAELRRLVRGAAAARLDAACEQAAIEVQRIAGTLAAEADAAHA